ncbi:hypothetical protein [Solicola gregarius]|uniref:Uncharacterized protein n=1 Tax=Solicola gregarius TaxID=2908642 RepID=A0AA46YKA7_9ACTN|nr:hypothetical protein [Solicola gregarius]UYM05550.1 hypothetical protein L0C25_00230 [Solicola gregarius]
MPRRNRVDPWGDLHATPERGMFTGNRGCLVDDTEQVVRHHRGNLWITCLTSYRGWRVDLARPSRWTPIFFLDEVVALAAGHRPCGLCRRAAYESYREAVGTAYARTCTAGVLNGLLADERLRRGRGLDRAGDRRLWRADAAGLPDGVVYVDEGVARVVRGGRSLAFGFSGWQRPGERPTGQVDVLTPPTSVAALAQGYEPGWHPSAAGPATRSPVPGSLDE